MDMRCEGQDFNRGSVSNLPHLSEHRSRRCCKELVAACGLASIFLFLANVHLFWTVEALLADASKRDGRWSKKQRFV